MGGKFLLVLAKSFETARLTLAEDGASAAVVHPPGIVSATMRVETALNFLKRVVPAIVSSAYDEI